MEADYHRHDLDNHSWSLLEAHLSGQRGQWGGIAEDNRRFINGVLWYLRTGAPWRDLPPDYGGWKNTQRRFCRWRDKGLWEALLEVFVKEPGYEWLFIDATPIKVHAHGTGAKGGTQAVGRTKGGLTQKCIWPWMRMVCRSELLSRRVPLLIARRLGP